LIHLERVAEEIKEVGLYNLILQDVEAILDKRNPTTTEILNILKSNPEILEEYKQTNVEYNISNIHIRDIDINSIKDEKCIAEAKEVNRKLNLLREIEKYTLDFEHSSTLVIIFSIEFFVLFSVQYFIVLLDLKEWQWWIYGLFLSSVAVAWLYANRERKKFEKNSKLFEDEYRVVQGMLKELEERGCIKKDDLIIKECDEHV
jgi:hypothetical protein